MLLLVFFISLLFVFAVCFVVEIIRLCLIDDKNNSRAVENYRYENNIVMDTKKYAEK